MNNNLTKLLQSELASSFGYFYRLMFVCRELTFNNSDQEIFRELDNLKDVLNYFSKEVINVSYTKCSSTFTTSRPISNHSPYIALFECEKTIKNTEKLLYSILETENIDINKAFIESYTKIVNQTYKACFIIHGKLSNSTKFEIHLPRSPLINASEDNSNNMIPHFFIDKNTLYNLIDNEKIEDISIYLLAQKRQSLYEEFLKKGHKEVFNKNYQHALNFFIKASNYHASAECYTLIGWVHSLLGKLPEAKKYCVKAIELDPTYGPPYNDLGNYMQNEGRYSEALHWYDLAKKATNYQNKEYPYINSGRLYLAQHQYQKALNEFNIALTLAPYLEELHSTIAKLRENPTINQPHQFN